MGMSAPGRSAHERVVADRPSRRPTTAAYPVFFPAAAAYAALVVPLSVLSMRGRLPVAGFATPWNHAHELLFGFGFAVIAGFLLNRERRGVLGILLGLWLLARAAAVIAPFGLLAGLANVAFAFAVAGIAAPRFLGAGRKLRNQAVAPTLVAIGLATAAFHAGGLTLGVEARYAAVHAGVLLFALLMLFMAGRILAPAAAGAARRAGHHLEARVQPRLEATLLVLMALALVASLLPGTRVIAGSALLTAAVVAAVRLARWRLWWCWRRADLLCLGAGYAWLSAGLALWAAAELLGQPARGDALHAITVGGWARLA